MIYTGNYKNCKTKKYKTYSISKDKGKDANYDGDYYLELAPKESFFRVWKNNRGKIDEFENNRYYIEQFYNEILKNLNPKEIYKKLDNSILLCYEENNEFCHRHLVAAWLEYHLNIEIPEIRIENETIVFLERPEYIKKLLYEVMLKK